MNVEINNIILIKIEFISTHFLLFKLILTKILKKYRIGIMQLNTLFSF